ncbi:MAG: hypothetical protein GX567_11325 [Clostridia bacterium]|nr:hypothetical protein [Clostridia bacterium]
MKSTIKKNQSIKTMPDGVWESSRPKKEKPTTTPLSDLQGNGYIKKKTQ